MARRYEALDALRGICALLVALFHLKSAGYVAGSALIANSWLFVDFFFVLSGFVIAASYGERLRHGFSPLRFMMLRLGRVYPLHLVMLLVFAGFETFKFAIGQTTLTINPAWQSPNGPLELLQSLGLVQIFGLTEGLSWNGPSWSIAAEVWTYLVMALVLALARHRAGIIIALIGAASVIYLFLLGAPYLDRTYDHALLRCLYGFAIGMLTHAACQRLTLPDAGWLANLLEAGMIVLVLFFAMMIEPHGAASLLAPPIFACAVMVFAFERGAVSRLLTRPLPLLLGTLSYSIYMIHVFVEARMIDVFLLAARYTGLPLASALVDPAGRQTKILGTADQPWMGDLTTIIVLAVIVGLAWFGFHFVEKPCRTLVRSWVLDEERLTPVSRPPA